MTRVTYDTNIYISGIFWRGNPRKLIEKAIGKEVELFVSKDILKISRLIEVRTSVAAIKRDPSDNKILACAAESKSEIVATSEMLKILEK